MTEENTGSQSRPIPCLLDVCKQAKIAQESLLKKASKSFVLKFIAVILVFVCNYTHTASDLVTRKQLWALRPRLRVKNQT